MKIDPKDAVELCDEILQIIPEIPEDGEEFADSVNTKVLNIKKWIEENQHCSIAQMRALENMQAACERWVR